MFLNFIRAREIFISLVFFYNFLNSNVSSDKAEDVVLQENSIGPIYSAFAKALATRDDNLILQQGDLTSNKDNDGTRNWSPTSVADYIGSTDPSNDSERQTIWTRSGHSVDLLPTVQTADFKLHKCRSKESVFGWQNARKFWENKPTDKKWSVNERIQLANSIRKAKFGAAAEEIQSLGILAAKAAAEAKAKTQKTRAATAIQKIARAKQAKDKVVQRREVEKERQRVLNKKRENNNIYESVFPLIAALHVRPDDDLSAEEKEHLKAMKKIVPTDLNERLEQELDEYARDSFLRELRRQEAEELFSQLPGHDEPEALVASEGTISEVDSDELVEITPEVAETVADIAERRASLNSTSGLNANMRVLTDTTANKAVNYKLPARRRSLSDLSKNVRNSMSTGLAIINGKVPETLRREAGMFEIDYQPDCSPEAADDSSNTQSKPALSRRHSLSDMRDFVKDKAQRPFSGISHSFRNLKAKLSSGNGSEEKASSTEASSSRRRRSMSDVLTERLRQSKANIGRRLSGVGESLRSWRENWKRKRDERQMAKLVRDTRAWSIENSENASDNYDDSAVSGAPVADESFSTLFLSPSEKRKILERRQGAHWYASEDDTEEVGDSH